MPQLTIETFPSQQESIEHLYEWILKTIRPYTAGRILETESGSGLFSSKLIQQDFEVELNANSEPDREYLREKFKGISQMRAVHKINFRTKYHTEQKYTEAENRFQTVMAIGNIGENYFYEKGSIEKAKRFLIKDGNLIIAGRCRVDVFPGSEPDLNEIRMYTFPHISQLLSNCQFLMAKYFNWKGLSFLAVGKKL